MKVEFFVDLSIQPAASQHIPQPASPFHTTASYASYSQLYERAYCGAFSLSTENTHRDRSVLREQSRC